MQICQELRAMNMLCLLGVCILAALHTAAAAQLEVTSGKPASIQCPGPDEAGDVVWLYPNGTRVAVPGPNVKAERSTLVIQNVTDADAGDFICLVPASSANNLTIGYPVRVVVKELVEPYWQQHATNAGYAFLAAFIFLAVCAILYLTHRYSWNRRHKSHLVENGGTTGNSGGTDNGHSAPVMDKGYANPVMEVEAEETIF